MMKCDRSGVAVESAGKLHAGRRRGHYANKLPPTAVGGSVVELIVEDSAIS